MSQKRPPESASKSTVRSVPAAKAERKDPSRMMGLLIVDVLAARKAGPKPASKKGARASRKERG